jgi:hypothetical protein
MRRSDPAADGRAARPPGRGRGGGTRGARLCASRLAGRGRGGRGRGRQDARATHPCPLARPCRPALCPCQNLRRMRAPAPARGCGRGVEGRGGRARAGGAGAGGAVPASGDLPGGEPAARDPGRAAHAGRRAARVPRGGVGDHRGHAAVPAAASGPARPAPGSGRDRADRGGAAGGAGPDRDTHARGHRCGGERGQAARRRRRARPWPGWRSAGASYG